MSQNGELRIGDIERQQAMQALLEHHSQGRLTLTEYDERVTRVTQAVTLAELAPVFTDLPGPHPACLLPSGPVMPPSMAIPAPPKSKVAAGLLQIFLPFGIGRFYTGHTGIAIAQLALFVLGILPCGAGTAVAVIWCVVDGIVILATASTDAQGRPMY